MCSRCEVWELCSSDNACSWCGFSLLDFAIQADRSRFPGGEYPPPVEVTVLNLSAHREIDVESISSSAGWIELLNLESVPQRIGPGQQKRFLLDIDTVAATKMPGPGEVKVSVAHTGSRSLTLEIV